MRCLQLPRRRSARRSARPYGYVVFLLTALALLVVPAVSAAGGFTERVASARWALDFQCPDGSTAADGRMIVETDNFIAEGTTPDPNPPLRVGFTGQCPDGTFSLGLHPAGADAFRPEPQADGHCQRHVHRRAGQPGRDAPVSVDARWRGAGPIETTVNAPWLDAQGARGDRDGEGHLRRQHARPRRLQLPVPRAVHARRQGEVASAARTPAS